MSLDIHLSTNHCNMCGRFDEVFHANITHNLAEMAEELGIYRYVWSPEESGISKAEQLIPILEGAIHKMKKEPKRFREFDSPNGWGTYDDFLPWLEKYLAACKVYPNAIVRSDR